MFLVFLLRLRTTELKNREEDVPIKVGGISTSFAKFFTISLSENFRVSDKILWRIFILGYIRNKEKKDRILTSGNPFDTKNRKVPKS